MDNGDSGSALYLEYYQLTFLWLHRVKFNGIREAGGSASYAGTSGAGLSSPWVR